jgi:hypothetical protein
VPSTPPSGWRIWCCAWQQRHEFAARRVGVMRGNRRDTSA